MFGPRTPARATAMHGECYQAVEGVCARVLARGEGLGGPGRVRRWSGVVVCERENI